MAASIKVLVVDDQEVVRVGIKSLLNGTDLKVVGEAANSEQALKQIAKLKPDVVLLDVKLPDGDGLNVLGRVRLDQPELPIVMLSAYDNPTYVARSVALGANGFLLKGAGRDKILATLRAAAGKENAWVREELRRIAGALATPRMPIDVEVPLTERENQVLCLIAQGKTNKQIAEELDISYETIKEHVQHTLRKLHLTDRTQAAVWAVRKGIV